MARKTRRDRDQARLQATGHQDMSEIMVEITFGPIDQMAMEFPELEFNRLQPGAFEAGPGPTAQHAPGMQTRSMTAWSACHLSTPVRRRMANTHANLVLEPPPEPPAPIPLFPPVIEEHPATLLPEAPADNSEAGGACATKPSVCHHGLAEELTPEIDVNSAIGLGEAPCTAGSSSAAWEKVLWKEQAYADNHVDHTFLEDLVVNSQLPHRQYWAMVMDAVSVSQQLSLAAAAVLAPVHLLAGTLTAMQLLIINAVLLILGYAVCALLGGHLLGGSLGRGLRQGCLLVGGVYFLSPLLKTLAATVSGDSVIALAVAALVIHLFLHDYSFVNSSTDKLSGTVALAAGALAAVLVASMMPSELHVFAQVLFALELFLLSPFVRRYVRAASSTAHATSAILLASLTAAGIATVSLGLGAAYVAVHLALTLLCPLALARIAKYKAKINGPWDEAVPHIPDQLHMPDKFPGPQPRERHAHAD